MVYGADVWSSTKYSNSNRMQTLQCKILRKSLNQLSVFDVVYTSYYLVGCFIYLTNRTAKYFIRRGVEESAK